MKKKKKKKPGEAILDDSELMKKLEQMIKEEKVLEIKEGSKWSKEKDSNLGRI